MKNSLLIFLLIFFSYKNLYANDLNIKSLNISIDKDKQLTVFKDEVVAKDSKNNILETDYAEYDKKLKLLISKGKTKIVTSGGYSVMGSNVSFDNTKNFIFSKEPAIIEDPDKNQIFLQNFDYIINENFFKSVGKIEVKDVKNNTYNFSQIYIDEKKREIVGTDIKAYLNEESLKLKKENKPRIFANTIKINDGESKFTKSIFTMCDYRKNDKCPPWSIQSKKMLHDKIKKTIYYDHAIVKMYDVPIFYFPKLAHPDPTVKRRSGFLPPTFANSKNLNTEIKIPYFWAINDDKNFTLESSLYSTDHPLLVGKYHQAFANAELVSDFGYTKGYKKETSKKKKGDKSHFFSEFKKKFESEETESGLKVSLKKVSDNKYLKLHKIDSTLVNYEESQLHNEINFTHENKNSFFELNSSIIETLKDNYNDKYEYIAPEVTLDKNLFSDEKFGNLDLQTNFKVHNYDTNKNTNFLVNDLRWNSRDIIHDSGLKIKFLSNIKNINYETKNVSLYKQDPTSELFGALGFLSDLKFEKIKAISKHYFTPKFLVRYAPGDMRKENSGSRLNPVNAFSIDRLDHINNFETGLTSTIGFDYKIKDEDKNLDFSIAQILNTKENKKMSSESSLDEKLSDLVGSASYDINNKFNLNYNFALDQNYNDLNYNDFGTKMNFGALNIDFNYLQEKNHIGDKDYFKSKFSYKNDDKGLFSFETKRNLITNSSEFYNLSYEYINDCLRAGIVYRREFYNDSELEAENSLFFKITLTPFGGIDTPALN